MGRLSWPQRKLGSDCPEEEALALRSAPSAIERAIRATQDWTALPADAYVQGRAVMRRELRVPFRGWTMVLFTTYGGIRQRVNAVLGPRDHGVFDPFYLWHFINCRANLNACAVFPTRI
jgi:hypothetical protein